MTIFPHHDIVIELLAVLLRANYVDAKGPVLYFVGINPVLCLAILSAVHVSVYSFFLLLSAVPVRSFIIIVIESYINHSYASVSHFIVSAKPGVDFVRVSSNCFPS